MKHELKLADIIRAKEALEAASIPDGVWIYSECPKCGFLNRVEPETKCRYCESPLTAKLDFTFVDATPVPTKEISNGVSENSVLETCDCCGDEFDIQQMRLNGRQMLCDKCRRENA